jgi:protein subunit release factor B
MNPKPTTPDPLAQRMKKLGIHPDELRESFVRSGGHGGQNVNKTSTCVLLTHLPSGTQVKCQTARTQAANRTLALTRLLDKIQDSRDAQNAAHIDQKEKARRRNRPRSRAAKERILTAKNRQSQKKANRRTPKSDY